MRLIDRYICREVISHAALGLVVFTFVLFVPRLAQLMELIVRSSSGLGNVLLLLLCTVAPVLTFTLPMAVLVGVLIGLGRLSADSEIVALHACGVGLRRLLVPIGAIALAATCVTLLTTFWLSPASLRTARRLEARVFISQVPYAIESRVFDERIPGFVLYVQDANAAATRWRGVFLASTDSGKTSSVTTAANATILQSPGAKRFELRLGKGSTHEYDPRHPDRYNVTTFGESDVAVDLTAVTAQKKFSMSPAEQPTRELLSDRGKNRLEARVEFQRRLAFPAACLVFAFLGIPIGVRPRRGGRAAGLILTLVLIGGYYFLFVYGDHMAAQGRVPPWAGVWAANIATLLAGLLFFGRVEQIHGPNRFFAALQSLWSRWRSSQKSRRTTPQAATSNGTASPVQPVAGIRRAIGTTWAMAFPTLLDAYLLRQFFYYFGVMLAAFLLIFDAFTLFDLLADISRNHVSALVVLDYFRYLSPWMLYQLAPLAILVATLVTLAILAKNNEVIAFKASGVSLYRLVLPLLLAGTLLAGGMFLLDDTFLPYANQRQDALRNQIKGRPAQTYAQPAQQWILGEGSKIYNYELFDPDRDLFGGLNVFELNPQTFQIQRRIYAARATWEPSLRSWVLTSGWVRDFGPDGRIVRYEPFQATTLPELKEPPSYFRREVRQYYQMNWQQLGNYIARLRHAGFDTARLSVQWQNKFAFPLIAAIIVFLGAPFAFLVGARGAVGGLALGVGVGITYWATAALFEAMGAVGQLPPVLAAWAPDLIFGFLGVYFFLRMPT